MTAAAPDGSTAVTDETYGLQGGGAADGEADINEDAREGLSLLGGFAQRGGGARGGGQQSHGGSTVIAPPFPKLDRHHVQWAAQFGVASELCRRGYSVSFTMGNATPIADLLAMAPSGAAFAIDVKGQSTKNFWQIKAKRETPNLFYALCFLGELGERCRFFLLPQAQLLALMRAYEVSGVKFDPDRSGINWGACFDYEERWDLLPP